MSNLELQNFNDLPQQSLKEQQSIAVYDQLSEVLSKAHIALFRVPIDKRCAKRYKRWFGVTHAEMKFWVDKPFVDVQVKANIKKIHTKVMKEKTIIRPDMNPRKSTTVAYVRHEDEECIIYLCPPFFKRAGDAEARRSAVGTIIHELGHKYCKWEDIEYGGARKLAEDEPLLARKNARNYQKFCDAIMKMK